ncbi:restriction endonuclease subunit S [Spongiibacter tropicus]|uniref:restriction endonuclease subunit S n=1 Tax=Spongiibacter tropicus TaxID=454602 RepID=UPI0035BE7FB5
MVWVTKKLPEALFIQEGPGIRKYEYEEGGYPMINVRCVQDGYIDMTSSKSASMELATTKWKHFQVDAGDILYTISGTIGRSAIVKESDLPLLMNTSVVRFKTLTPDLIPKFAYYYFKTDKFINELLDQSTGTAIKNVGPSHLKKMDISHPSLTEQKRIVAILDQAFADIDKARALTEQNLKNAREMFESYLQQVFSQRGVGWVKAELFDHVRFIDYRGKTPTKIESGLRLITAKNVRMGYLKDYPMEFVSPDSYDEWMTRGIPVKGDVLFTTEAPLANVAQLDTDEKVVFAQRIITMQPDREVLNDSFLKYLLMSSPIQRRIHEKGTGATATGIKASLLKKIPIEFPGCLQEQGAIVKKLDSLTSHVEGLEKIYNEKLEWLDALKKSLLQKAFSGELTNSSAEAAA